MSNTSILESKMQAVGGNTKAFSHEEGIAFYLSPLIITPLEKELIGVIRKHGEITKPDLVDSLPYSRSKINGGINSLLKKGTIKSTGAGDYTGGRRSIKFSINGESGLVAGVDIGATSIDLILTDLAGKVYARYGEPGNVRQGPLVIVGRVCHLLNKMITENGLNKSRLFAIGMGVPGPVDNKAGMLVSPPIMPGWDGFPIIKAMQADFPRAKVMVDNDVNVMALGEKSNGAGKDIQNLIFIKIGTGIGAGIICHGEIYRGNNGCAGDIGHISVKKDGPMCHCGNTGCLEAVAAGPAIADRGVKAALEGKSPILLKHYEANGQKLRAEDVGLAAGEGDPVSIEIIRNSGQIIGDVLAGLVNFFNPGLILIGGGVSRIGNLLLSSIRQVVLTRSLPLATRNLRIDFSSSGQDAGVAGAISLAIDNVFTVEGLVDVN
jgi:glucokinase-like ROK family protein